MTDNKKKNIKAGLSTVLVHALIVGLLALLSLSKAQPNNEKEDGVPVLLGMVEDAVGEDLGGLPAEEASPEGEENLTDETAVEEVPLAPPPTPKPVSAPKPTPAPKPQSAAKPQRKQPRNVQQKRPLVKKLPKKRLERKPRKRLARRPKQTAKPLPLLTTVWLAHLAMLETRAVVATLQAMAHRVHLQAIAIWELPQEWEVLAQVHRHKWAIVLSSI